MAAVNYSLTSNITGTGVAAADADSVRKLWSKKVTIWDQAEDPWRMFEGTSEDSVIWTTTDTSKGVGDTVTFTNMAGFYNTAHYGEDGFDGPDDYEDLYTNSYSVRVDFVRNAVRYTERLEERMGLRGELVSNFTENLGKWAAREKASQMGMCFLRDAQGENVVYAGDKAAYNDLRLTDTLNYNGIVDHTSYLKSLATPAKMGKDQFGNPIHQYCIFATTPALNGLESDSTFQSMLQEGDLRGDANRLFRGGWLSIRDNFIKEFTPIDHDGPGPIGSPCNPKAKLGAAITAGTATFDILGGGKSEWSARTRADYFRWFPGFAYEFHPDDIVDPTAIGAELPLSAPRYVLIYNHTGVDRGKWGFYSYSDHQNYGLKVTGRLASAASGIANTTIGNVVWNSDYNTDAHPIGSTILLCNSSAVPYGHTFFLGAGAALRAYGKYRNERREDPPMDGGMKRAVYTASIFGQTTRRDVLNRRRNFLVMAHAIRYRGMRLTAQLATP